MTLLRSLLWLACGSYYCLMAMDTAFPQSRISKWVIPGKEVENYKFKFACIEFQVMDSVYSWQTMPNPNNQDMQCSGKMGNDSSSEKIVVWSVYQSPIHILLRIHNDPQYRRDAVLSLLRNPATDPNLPDSLGNTPLELANQTDDSVLIKAIKKHPRYVSKKVQKIPDDALPKSHNRDSYIVKFKKELLMIGSLCVLGGVMYTYFVTEDEQEEESEEDASADCQDSIQ